MTIHGFLSLLSRQPIYENGILILKIARRDASPQCSTSAFIRNIDHSIKSEIVLFTKYI